MRDLDGRRLPRRVDGRAAIEQAMQRLVIRTARFAEHRARTAADQLWSANVVDVLRWLLDTGKQ